MDHAERYYQLSLLGRDAFVQSVAPAALVRRLAGGAGAKRLRTDAHEDDTLVAALDQAGITGEGPAVGLEIHPLVKKPGAPFADMITVGRTANNDVVLNDITVSRFHAFFRQRGDSWIVCDAGSKNGTKLEGEILEARKERPIQSGETVRIGDLEVGFYKAFELFALLQDAE